MNQAIICTAGNTAALRLARQALYDRGVAIVDSPAPDITHLLLPVPSFEESGRIKGGGILEHILTDLPENVTVIGGNLHHPALHGYSCMDLLQDEQYVAHNAAITADCAIRIAGSNLPVVFDGCPILIIGWGRIGKCLAAQLKNMGARVTVASRKSSDRAMLRALGYATENTQHLGQSLMRYRVIFNTAPTTVINEMQADYCTPECIKIDLASKPGIAGTGVIWARGLPGKDAPESSGELIAKTVIRLLSGKEGVK